MSQIGFNRTMEIHLEGKDFKDKDAGVNIHFDNLYSEHRCIDV